MTENGSGIQVFAIIPAAGPSQRMGRPKQLLPVGEGTMLEHVIETALWGDIDGLCVVTTSAVDAELELSEDPRFILALNDEAGAEMIDSVRIGVAAVYARCPVQEGDGFLVCPGDMPEVTREDVQAISAAYRADSGHLWIAAFQGKAGHPMAFPAAWAAEVRQLREGGLNVLRQRHAADVRLIERNAPGVLRDVDTPEDYQRWSAQG